MSNSSKTPRVVRKHDCNECYTEWTYREKAFAKLMEDFGKRCAYSLLHVDEISEHNMEVDHHNPTLRASQLHRYGNLYPAFSLCNNSKRKVWPKKADLKKRRRYIDCCIEQDYGVHFYEDRPSGELLPVTPEGVYHIENCDLNNDWLKKKRLDRTEDKQILTVLRSLSKSANPKERADACKSLAAMEARVERNIPEIPLLPAGVEPL